MNITANERMWAAVTELTTRQRADVGRDSGDAEHVWIDPLLDQLLTMVRPSGELSSGGSGGGKPGSRPPLSVDALSLVDEIERRTAGRGHLASGIRTIARKLERQHDEDGQNGFAETVSRWSVRIRAMSGAETTRTRPLAVICPSCASQWVWDMRDGETIRKYAVYATFTDGELVSFGCLTCKATWKRGDDLDALVDYQLGR